jgi:hypothetical protein
VRAILPKHQAAAPGALMDDSLYPAFFAQEQSPGGSRHARTSWAGSSRAMAAYFLAGEVSTHAAELAPSSLSPKDMTYPVSTSLRLLSQTRESVG